MKPEEIKRRAAEASAVFSVWLSEGPDEHAFNDLDAIIEDALMKALMDEYAHPPRLERYLNIYSGYASRTVYDSQDEARQACGHDPLVTTIKLVQMEP